MIKPKRPIKVASLLARKINAGSRIEKHGGKATKTLYAASIGLIGFSLTQKTKQMTLPLIGSAGLIAHQPLSYLARVLPKKLKTNTLNKLIGKPRLATVVAKSVPNAEAKAILYLIANAKSLKEQEEIKLALKGEGADLEILTQIAKRAIQSQGDEFSKELYLELRCKRGIHTKHLENASTRISQLIRSNQVTTNARYRQLIMDKALPLAISHAMDGFRIYDSELRKRIFNALREQSRRIGQKEATNSSTEAKDLIQDSIMGQHATQLGMALDQAFNNRRKAENFLHTFVRINGIICDELHQLTMQTMVTEKIMEKERAQQ